MIENVADPRQKQRSWGLFATSARLVDAGYSVRSHRQHGSARRPTGAARTVVLAPRLTPPTFLADQTDPARQQCVKAEWIGDLPPIGSGECDPADPMHEASPSGLDARNHQDKCRKDGGSRPAGVGPECLQRARQSFGGYIDVYSRLAWSEPAPTVTARCRTPSCGRFVHPEQHRGPLHGKRPCCRRFRRTGISVDRSMTDTSRLEMLSLARGLGLCRSHRVVSASDNEIGVFEVENKPVGACSQS